MKIRTPYSTRLSGTFLACLMPCVFLSSALATVTVEVYFENGSIPTGSLAAIVADTNEDGFLPLTDSIVSGSALSVGALIGGSDDRIIALFSSTAGPEWSPGAGFGHTLPSLDYAAHGISEGTPLIIYVFPSHSVAGSFFIIGDEFIVYRSSASGGSGGDIPFEAPADPGVYTLSALTSGNGGDFDPVSPAPEETYLAGNAGSTGDGSPDDHGNSRQDATSLSIGGSSGNLAPGDLDFFEFLVTESTTLTMSGSGEALTKGWIFDEAGNLIYSPEGGAPFSFQRLFDPGKYFIVMQGADESEEGDYDLSFEVAKAASAPGSPDLTIGTSAGKQKGGGLYSPSGSGQVLVVKAKRGKKVTAVLSVSNSGGQSASLVLRGSKGSKFHKMKYIQLGGGNVTASVGRGGYTASYNPGQIIFYKVDMKPTKAGKERGKKGKFTFDAAGAGGSDRGVVKTKVSK